MPVSQAQRLLLDVRKQWIALPFAILHSSAKHLFTTAAASVTSAASAASAGDLQWRPRLTAVQQVQVQVQVMPAALLAGSLSRLKRGWRSVQGGMMQTVPTSFARQRQHRGLQLWHWQWLKQQERAQRALLALTWRLLLLLLTPVRPPVWSLRPS